MCDTCLSLTGCRVHMCQSTREAILENPVTPQPIGGGAGQLPSSTSFPPISSEQLFTTVGLRYRQMPDEAAYI